MNEIKLTPEEALEILDRAASQAPLVRNDHIACQVAIQVLRELIPKPVEKLTKEEKKKD